MQRFAASLGRDVAISFPTAALFLLAVFAGWIGGLLVWHSISPWRERVRLVNDENDRIQRRRSGSSND
jgi:hypothetical protein